MAYTPTAISSSPSRMNPASSVSREGVSRLDSRGKRTATMATDAATAGQASVHIGRSGKPIDWWAT
jgi:hypothetical protein